MDETCIYFNFDMLLGILLGYGEESAKAFQEAQENYKGNFAPAWSDTYCGIEAKRPNNCKIYPVEFMGNPNSPKIQQLFSIYENELLAIWNVYHQKNDSLVFFLECLCSGRD